jgi:hypothetical protein
MATWRGAFSVLICVLSGCGGSEFDSASTGGAGGGGGNAGAGGSSGAAGSAGATSGGGTSGGASGTAGAGGGAAAGGSSGSGGAGGAPPITVVNASSPTEVSTADVPTLTMSPTPHAGNAIVVGISCLATAEQCTIAPNGVTDNQGNTYTRIIQGEPILSSSQGARAYIFIAESVGASSGSFVISVDPNGSVPPDTQTVVWGAIEVSGLAAAPSLDASGSSLVGDSNATSTTASTDLPTTQANELAIAVLTMRSEDTNMLITPAGGWTSHHSHQNGASGPPGHSMISKLLSSTEIISHTWTHDPPTRGVAAVIATFKGAAQN